MAERAKIASGCRSKFLPRSAAASARRLPSAAGSWPTNALTAAATSATRVSSAPLSRAPAWISCQPRAAASSTMPSSRRSAPRPIPIPGKAATNACRNSFPTNVGRSAATPNRRRRSARRCTMPAARCRSSAPAASIISRWRRIISPAASATSSARHARRSPIPDWFRKFHLGVGAEVRVCEYTNYCEGLDQKHKPVTCQLWDKLASAGAERRTPDGKRRLTAPAWQPPT